MIIKNDRFAEGIWRGAAFDFRFKFVRTPLRWWYALTHGLWSNQKFNICTSVILGNSRLLNKVTFILRLPFGFDVVSKFLMSHCCMFGLIGFVFSWWFWTKTGLRRWYFLIKDIPDWFTLFLCMALCTLFMSPSAYLYNLPLNINRSRGVMDIFINGMLLRFALHLL